MATTNYPEKYLQYNQQLSKQLAIVMIIEGIPYTFGISDTFEIIRWGTSGLIWGLPGLVWGGLKKIGGPNGVGGVKPYIVLDPSMTIQQRIEPEQGRGNIGTLQMTLIDYNGEVSFMIAPGNMVNEIMTSKQTTIYIGFQQTSFPQDYVILYRGYITSLDTPPGIVRFQISDGTMKSRQPICNTPTTNLDGGIDDTQTTITVLSTDGFYSHILGPDGTYSDTVHTYIKIDDEIMEYDSSGILNSTQFSVTRGALGTVPSTHDTDAVVSNSFQIGQNIPDGGINFIDASLQLMLSGWNGPCDTDLDLNSCGVDLGDLDGFVLGLEGGLQMDAFLTLGLTVGDYFYVTGATDPLNDIEGRITGFAEDLNGFTNIVLVDTPFNSYEFPTNATISFRSQYDVLPVLAGSKCRMRDVDTITWQQIRRNYFQATIYHIAMYYDAPVFVKDTISQDFMLPMGCYQISRFGRISVSVTKPPLPGSGQNIVQLDFTNILDPDKVHVTRSTNSRCFYNQISYEYDYSPTTQEFSTISYFLNPLSAENFNQILTLPIQAKALHSTFGSGSVASQRGRALLTRYQNVAIILELTVNWSVGSLIEVSDIVLIVDNGNLKIMNFATGIRNIGSQLFEVIDRQYNVTQGNVKLRVLSGLGFDINSRFGLISPSTQLADGGTTTSLRLMPSYGQSTIAGELAKWTPYFGLPIVVHNRTYTDVGTATLVGLDPLDPTALQITPALSFLPGTGYFLEIANYPTGTDKTENSQYKALYTYLTPTIDITSGASPTQFDIGVGDVSKLTVGNTVIVRKADWSEYSQEVTLTDVTGTTLTVDPALKDSLTNSPITPDNTWVLEGIGFHDHTGYYRYS